MNPTNDNNGNADQYANSPPTDPHNATVQEQQHQNTSSIDLESEGLDNEAVEQLAFDDNYYEYDEDLGYVAPQSSESQSLPEETWTYPPFTNEPMRPHYDQPPSYDYYNDPRYVTTNEEAERYMNDPPTVSANTPSEPTAEERVVMLEAELRTLMNTNTTLQQSIQDIQKSLASMSITTSVGASNVGDRLSPLNQIPITPIEALS